MESELITFLLNGSIASFVLAVILLRIEPALKENTKTNIEILSYLKAINDRK